ncbi:hypothetical protein LCGC14_1240380 [marine sediment metagenome]|uniref:KTSC domain-containing protein n=1 Tax=marine sediment metagenome TaxID=412755 RepID=A0A0F9LA89_9ZZZZ
MPDMNNVESSNIAAIGYDEFQAELHVQFKGRPTVYVYQDVPRNIFDDIMRSESKGAFLSAQVKGVYTFDKLEEKAPPVLEEAAPTKDLLTMTMTRPVFVQLQQLIAQNTICMELTETSPGIVQLVALPPQSDEAPSVD